MADRIQAKIVALRFNPFQPNKIVAPGMFTGRADEIFRIEQCLFQAKHGNAQHFLIEGERGIGKSSLLLLISNIASGKYEPIQTPESFKFVHLSIDLAGVKDQLDLVRTIARKLRSAISERSALKDVAQKAWDFLSNWEILGVRYHKGSPTEATDDARDRLVETIAHFYEAASTVIDGIFITIDEADAPPESAELGEFLKLFTERLTNLDCNNVLIGLAGLPSTISKLRASHESSPRLFEILKLKPLRTNERREIVKKGLLSANQKNDKPTSITEDGLDLIAVLSEGYPHFIQEFSYFAFAEDDDYEIDESDVATGAYKENGALMQLGSKFFAEMYHAKISSEEYRKVLRSMAPYGDEWVSRPVIIRESGVPESNVNNALGTLKAREIILTDDTRRGFYRLPTRSFAAWINAIQSVGSRHDTGSGNPFGETID